MDALGIIRDTSNYIGRVQYDLRRMGAVSVIFEIVASGIILMLGFGLLCLFDMLDKG